MYVRSVFCNQCATGSGEEKAVTGSADRIVRFWDLSRRQASLVCNLKTNSYVGAGKSRSNEAVASDVQHFPLLLCSYYLAWASVQQGVY